MSKRKLKVSTIEVPKKFDSFEEALKYYKSLDVFVKRICEKEKGLCQVAVGISNIIGDYVAYAYRERNDKVGKGKVKRIIYDKRDVPYVKEGTNGEYGKIYNDIHMHILLISYPGETFAVKIRKYIKKNWLTLEEQKEIDKYKHYWRGKETKVYNKACDIGLGEYIFKQSEIIRTIDYDYTGLKLIPEGYNLRKLYDLYLKINTEKEYNFDEWSTREGRKKIEKEYREMSAFYYSISKELKEKEELKYKKQLYLDRISVSIFSRNISRRMPINIGF